MKINKLFSTATEYLDSHENMSGLLQVAQRLSEIQKACQSILPRHFSACSVFKLESGKMIIGVPNQSIAARIRQQIPYLQAELGKAGLASRFDPPESPAGTKTFFGNTDNEKNTVSKGL